MSSSMKKTNVVVDNAKNCRSRTTKRKSSSLFREMATDTQTLLQQQRIKEKQLLKQWKADRAYEKKTRLIIRKKAHDVRRGDKERFDENDGDDLYIWKHDGCDEACLKDNCMQYMLDYLFSNE